MQSINQQQVAEPVRPEPMISDRIRMIGQADRSSGGVRTELADAFRSLGRGVHAKAAYRQTKAFYRSSGHAWTRALK